MIYYTGHAKLQNEKRSKVKIISLELFNIWIWKQQQAIKAWKCAAKGFL